MKQKPFLDYLLNARLLDPAQLRPVLQHMRQSDDSLVEVLTANGLIEDIALARALAAFHGYKVVDIARVTPKRDALSRAQGSFCRKHHILPFGVDRESGDLLVAVSDPYQVLEILRAFQTKTSQRIRPYIAGRKALIESIDRHYFGKGEMGKAEVGKPEVGKAEPMASLASLGEPSPLGFRSLEVSSMGAVPGYGDSGLGARAPAPSLSQFGVTLTSDRSDVPAAAANISSVDQFFDAQPVQEGSSAGWGAGGDILGGRPVGAQGAAPHADSVAELRRENAALRQQLHRLEASMQLEISLVRQIVEMLVQSGAIDRQTYIETMGRLR